MTNDYLTKTEAADLLKITPRTLDRWATAGHLSVYRMPPAFRAVRFDRREVEALLKPRKGNQ